MTTYAIYEAAGGDREPVVVLGYADVTGRPLDATLLPHERQQQAAYVRVQRNAGAGAVHLVEATRVHASELGSCDVVRDPISGSRRLMCVTCAELSEPAVAGLPA
jgi:hypothetical protein